jgi:hypothetical protein
LDHVEWEVSKDHITAKDEDVLLDKDIDQLVINMTADEANQMMEDEKAENIITV